MTDTSTAPYSSLAREIAPRVIGSVEHLEEYRSFAAIDAETHTAWRLVRTILIGTIEHNKALRRAGLGLGFQDFGRPTRVEAFMGTSSFRTRGIAIFDEKGDLIVHVVNALLGYDGNGPDLSWHILNLLGISDEMFSDIQAATSQQRGTTPYTIIILYDDATGWTWQQIE